MKEAGMLRRNRYLAKCGPSETGAKAKIENSSESLRLPDCDFQIVALPPYAWHDRHNSQLAIPSASPLSALSTSQPTADRSGKCLACQASHLVANARKPCIKLRRSLPVGGKPVSKSSKWDRVGNIQWRRWVGG